LSAEIESQIESLSIKGSDGFTVEVLSLGARLGSVCVPVGSDCREVTVRYPTLGEYGDDAYYIGATVGRFANRIAHAEISIAGRSHKLTANDKPGGHCLHGGRDGLHRQSWALKKSANGDAIECRYRSPDGAEGFPGNIDIVVTYRIIAASTLSIEFSATTDRETVLSLANHAYFNLGDAGGTIDDHELLIHADEFTPSDAELIPTGDLCSVSGTPMDFRSEPRVLGGDESQNPPFDSNFVIRGTPGQLRPAAELYSPSSGLGMKLSTTQAGMQLYTGDYLGSPFTSRQGLCLEAQNFPNAPNQSGFPSAVLIPEKPYREQTVLEFVCDRPL
jgi:aldose 1-epimerase